MLFHPPESVAMLVTQAVRMTVTNYDIQALELQAQGTDFVCLRAHPVASRTSPFKMAECYTSWLPEAPALLFGLDSSCYIVLASRELAV